MTTAVRVQVVTVICTVTLAVTSFGASAATRLQVESPVTVAGNAGGMATHGNSLWVGSEKDGITEIDVADAKVARVLAPPAGFEMSTGPTSISYGSGGLWAAGWIVGPMRGDYPAQIPAITRLDLATGAWGTRVSFPVLGDLCSTSAVAVAREAIWASYSCFARNSKGGDETSCAVVRVDPASGRIVAKLSLGVKKLRGHCLLTVQPDAVWVVSPSENVIWRINPRTNKAGAPITLESRGFSLTAALVPGRGAMWTVVTCCVKGRDSRLVRIDPHTGEITKTIQLGFSSLRTPGATVAVGGASIWITRFNWEFSDREDAKPLPGGVLRLDPVSFERRDQLEISPEPTGALFVGGSLWITHNDSRDITRLRMT
jgi:hypothetical protein